MTSWGVGKGRSFASQAVRTSIGLFALALSVLDYYQLPILPLLTRAHRRLRELRAVNCGNFNLTASELHCPVLQEANFFGCRQLDAEGEQGVLPICTSAVGHMPAACS